MSPTQPIIRVATAALAGLAACGVLAIASCGRGDFDRAAERYCRMGSAYPCAVDAGEDAGAPETDAGGAPEDGGEMDAGSLDAGELDAGADDGGNVEMDAGTTDAGAADAGGCGAGCSGGQTCVNGECTCPTASPDFCVSGCTNVTSDPGNCGACAHACAPGDLCVAGVCIQPFDAGPYNLAFVTSAAVIPGAIGGVPAADALCQSAATDAGLPGTYKALLGTTGTDPFARFAGSRGWVRTDLKPFGDSITTLSSWQLYYPLRIDELGNDVGEVPVATGVKFGTLQHTCGGWTDPDAGVYDPGNSARGGTGATFGGWNPQKTCDQPAHLYCFGIGKSAALTLPPPAGRLLFELRGFYSPTSGLSAADAMCAADAADAGLSGTFLAVLATSTQAAADRFDAGTWFLTNGMEVDGFLTAQGPNAPVNVFATRGYDVNSSVVATGSSFPLSPAVSNCMDWMTNSGGYNFGVATASGPSSFYSNTSNCGSSTRLYCAEP